MLGSAASHAGPQRPSEQGVLSPVVANQVVESPPTTNLKLLLSSYFFNSATFCILHTVTILVLTFKKILSPQILMK